jgi:hypothetical protein
MGLRRHTRHIQVAAAHRERPHERDGPEIHRPQCAGDDDRQQDADRDGVN